MSDESRSCPSCGARVAPTADRCELCGTAVDPITDSGEKSATTDAGASSVDEESAGGSEEMAPSGDVDHVYCHQCGVENPAEANFCSQCGTKLENVTAEAPSDNARSVTADLPTGSSSAPDQGADSSSPDGPDDAQSTQVAMGKRIVFTVGLGVLLVVGLFFITRWSQDAERATEAGGTASVESGANAAQAGSGSGAAPMTGSGVGESSTEGSGPKTDLSTLVERLGGEVDGPVASKIDSVREQLDGEDDTNKQEVRRRLVRLYTGAGAPGRAAVVQSKVANQTDDLNDRRRAANLLYKWMRQVEQRSDRTAMANVAQHVATAYEEVARQAPQDLDARTRMGEAYLLTNNPMKGIEAINAVLKDDSTFVPARFQKGLALLQINRIDQALQQFERVKVHADSDDPFYKQANRAIEVINEQTSTSGEAGTSSE